METDFIQCQPNKTKWRKKILQQAKANKNHSNSDATLLIATVRSCFFSFASVWLCWVTTLFVFYTVPENMICKAGSTITTIPKSTLFKKPPSCFKMNRKKPSSTRWTLLYIKLLWTLPLFRRCQLLWHTWDFTRIVFKLAKLVVLATMMECLFIPVVTFFGLTVTRGCRPTLWHHLVSWWVPLKRGPLNWVT